MDINGVPDGGYGWVIVFGSFLLNFIVVGMSRGFGVMFVILGERFGSTATEIAWVHALYNSTRMLLAPLASFLCERFTTRRVVLVGSVLIFTGVTTSAFVPHLKLMYFTYGIVAGVGGSMLFAPSLIVVGEYFSSRKGTAMGLSTLGCGLGTMAFAAMFTFLIDYYGYVGGMLVIGAVVSHCAVAGALLRPLVKNSLKQQPLNPCRLVSLSNEELGYEESKQLDNDKPLEMDVLNGSCSVEKKACSKELREERTANVAISDHDLSIQTDLVQTSTCDGEAAFNEKKPENRSQKGELSDKDSRLCSPLAEDDINTEKSRKTDDVNINKIPSGVYHSKPYILDEPDPLKSKNNTNDTQSQSVANSYSTLATSDCKEYPETSEIRPEEKSWLSKQLMLLRNKSFLVYVLTLLTMPCGIQVVLLFIAAYAERNGVNEQRRALLIAIQGFTDIAGRLFVGFVFDLKPIRHRRRFLHAFLGILFGTITMAIGVASNFWSLVIVFSFHGFIEGAYHAQRATVLSEIVPREQIAMCVGYMTFVQGIGNLAFPLLGGVLRDSLGTFKEIFLLGGALLVLVSMLNIITFVFAGSRSKPRCCQRKKFTIS